VWKVFGLNKTELAIK